MLPCRRRMPSAIPVVSSPTTYAVRRGRKWISSSSSSCSSSQLNPRKANVAVVSARFQSGQRHGGFANEKEKFEKGLDNRYSNQTSLREGILSSFETELYSLIEVTVLNLCKKVIRDLRRRLPVEG